MAEGNSITTHAQAALRFWGVDVRGAIEAFFVDPWDAKLFRATHGDLHNVKVVPFSSSLTGKVYPADWLVVARVPQTFIALFHPSRRREAEDFARARYWWAQADLPLLTISEWLKKDASAWWDI